MSKHDKKVFSLTEDLQTIIGTMPRLEGLMHAWQEIAEGYQLYRKNGGAAIPGIEEHLGCKELGCKQCEVQKKEKKQKKVVNDNTPADNPEGKKPKKKDK